MYICIHACIHPHSCVQFNTCIDRPYHTRIYTHTHTHTYSLAVSLIKVSSFLAATLMATRMTGHITHIYTHTHTHTLSLPLSLSLSHQRIKSLCCNMNGYKSTGHSTHIYTRTHTHTLSLALSLIKESSLCAATLMATKMTVPSPLAATSEGVLRINIHAHARTHIHSLSLFHGSTKYLCCNIWGSTTHKYTRTHTHTLPLAFS